MRNRLISGIVVASLAFFAGCATSPPKPELPAAPREAGDGPGIGLAGSDPYTAALGTVYGVTEAVTSDHKSKAAERKTAAGTITIDCSVKLPDDPTDNPELCRSFQMEVIDEAGVEAARFRFGNDARYRFSGKPGRKYRVKPLIGKNWEFTVEPDRDLMIGERARVQLRQKE